MATKFALLSITNFEFSCCCCSRLFFLKKVKKKNLSEEKRKNEENEAEIDDFVCTFDGDGFR